MRYLIYRIFNPKPPVTVTQILGRLDPYTRQRGASMVEYALLVVLIAIVAIVTLRLVGREVSSVFNNIAEGLSETPPTTLP